ncbi:ABC transporter ATP-binding protein [Aliibacillus thermotolerans]|uniref:ABC transporter ATP-binding protein n=1 Tax=Aliibacillus thermotolerans TaxID=1834418 RepID=A0ABW0U5F1_9BACI|nr:ABC transporter ATP-binding protein [Aliibacillus thermotolerans]MDA3128536.1 ATP-binding cassette domain-containing protein [Aliibacillus thermotolerans]
MRKEILKVDHLKKYFPIKSGIWNRTVTNIKAVDNISFTVHEGETVGIVGESGCGKSTVARTILQLEQPTAGNIYFEGKNLCLLRKKELRRKRKEMQMIFQHPHSSLNPRQRLKDILYEAMSIQKVVPKARKNEQVHALLQKVGLQPHQQERYPHELSGGEKQRVAIARALAVQPKLIICDEIVSSLDISRQAQILHLLKKLQQDFNLTYLFISHDLEVVRYISDRVIVMYVGQIVEMATTQSLFESPMHPYTHALLSAIPTPHPKAKRKRLLLKGEVPSPVEPPSGCRFHPRCPFATETCKKVAPTLQGTKDVEQNHLVACHYGEDIARNRSSFF